MNNDRKVRLLEFNNYETGIPIIIMKAPIFLKSLAKKNDTNNRLLQQYKYILDENIVRGEE